MIKIRPIVNIGTNDYPDALLMEGEEYSVPGDVPQDTADKLLARGLVELVPSERTAMLDKEQAKRTKPEPTAAAEPQKTK